MKEILLTEKQTVFLKSQFYLHFIFANYNWLPRFTDKSGYT